VPTTSRKFEVRSKKSEVTYVFSMTSAQLLLTSKF
jgi:hypothetical protein